MSQEIKIPNIDEAVLEKVLEGEGQHEENCMWRPNLKIGDSPHSRIRRFQKRRLSGCGSFVVKTLFQAS